MIGKLLKPKYIFHWVSLRHRHRFMKRENRTSSPPCGRLWIIGFMNISVNVMREIVSLSSEMLQGWERIPAFVAGVQFPPLAAAPTLSNLFQEVFENLFKAIKLPETESSQTLLSAPTQRPSHFQLTFNFTTPPTSLSSGLHSGLHFFPCTSFSSVSLSLSLSAETCSNSLNTQ